jgi:hypothetical protein
MIGHQDRANKPSLDGGDGDPTEHDNDPYDFLTNGARAVRAFCRPRAVKVWGEVVDTTLEIGKAEFKCSIRVSRNSVSPPSSSSSASNTTTTATTTTGDESTVDNAKDEESVELATEFYLPLVHFASPALLEESKARWDPEYEKSVDMSSSSPKMYSGWNTSSSTSSNEEGRERLKRRVLQGIEERSDLLDVEVQVSVGKWKIRGQKLYWWYPHPSPSSSRTKRDDGDGDKEEEEEVVTIEVKRRGGAIKVKNGGWVDVEQTLRQAGKKRKEGQRSLCERLCGCDFGCVVM